HGSSPTSSCFAFGGGSPDPLAPFDFFDQVRRVRARAQVVAGDRVLSAAGERAGLDRAGVALFIERDPEGQFVGEAPIDRDPAAFVGAQEPDLAVAPPGAEYERAEDDDERRDLGAPPQPRAVWLGGEGLAPFLGPRRGGP